MFPSLRPSNISGARTFTWFDTSARWSDHVHCTTRSLPLWAARGRGSPACWGRKGRGTLECNGLGAAPASGVYGPGLRGAGAAVGINRQVQKCKVQNARAGT